MLAQLNWGYLIITFSALFLAVASYALLFGAFLPPAGIPLIDALARDTHYKYCAVFLIPTGAYFVIANWVGWQYYRNS